MLARKYNLYYKVRKIYCGYSIVFDLVDKALSVACIVESSTLSYDVYVICTT